MTQVIVRAMSQIRDALHEAVTESIEFQRRIAEIQTVAPRLGGSFASADRARRPSSPSSSTSRLAQATEGLYQTISDQFTGMSERANVMTAAMKLAKVGVMDFQDATTLITGTLNAFGMTSEQADSVAAKFFTTIKLGHVRGKELADTMGQVIPIASELGVSLDELNAAMVALTIGGLDAHKSVTGLRGAMTALLEAFGGHEEGHSGIGLLVGRAVDCSAKGLPGCLASRRRCLGQHGVGDRQVRAQRPRLDGRVAIDPERGQASRRGHEGDGRLRRPTCWTKSTSNSPAPTPRS